MKTITCTVSSKGYSVATGLSAMEEYRVILNRNQQKKINVLEYSDKLFRLNSAVVLAEGEAPTGSAGAAKQLSPLGMAASVLKYMHDANAAKTDPAQKKSLLVAGHTDTSGNLEYNRKLSSWRAETVLSLLTGDGKRFAAICTGWDRMRISDYKQILAWAAKTRGWDCDPGLIDDNDNNAAVNRFRKAYNGNGPGKTWAPKITEWGASNTAEVWEAYFNCYQEYIAGELGTSVAGLEEYRKQIVFASANRWVGCNEYHPRVAPGVDDLQEQQNRRVEVLIFEPGEAPDNLACCPDRSACNKDACILYDTTQYQQVPLPASGTTPVIPTPSSGDDLAVYLYDADGNRMPGTNYRLNAGTTFQGTAGPDGCVKVKLTVCPVTCTLEWGDITNGSYTHKIDLNIDCSGGSDVQNKASRMLANMGYPANRDLGSAVIHFEIDHNLPPRGCNDDGTIPAATCAAIETHYNASTTAVATV